MGRILYVDCFSGVSGDMLLGAMIDAGLDMAQLRHDLGHLGIDGYDLDVQLQTRHGIHGTHLDVVDHGGDRPVRNLAAIEEILGSAELSEAVLDRARKVFVRLAEAEAAVHGTTVEHIHFHEVGAVDTLVDIVGFCCALERLQIESVYASPLPLGSGTVRTEHGLLPVPAPATLALIADAGAPTLPSRADCELVTPTGAALLTTLASFERPAMRVEQVGYGFGTRELPWANMLRVWIGESLACPAGSEAPYGARHAPSEEHGHDHGHGHGDDHGHGHEHPHPHPHGKGAHASAAEPHHDHDRDDTSGEHVHD